MKYFVMLRYSVKGSEQHSTCPMTERYSDSIAFYDEENKAHEHASEVVKYRNNVVGYTIHNT